MKPHRLCMTHHLVLGYGLHKHMEVYVRSRTCPVMGHGCICSALLDTSVSFIWAKSDTQDQRGSRAYCLKPPAWSQIPAD